MLLAKVIMQSLDQGALEALLNQSKIEGKQPELQIQNHNVVEGSIEEKTSKVRTAFNAWSRDYRDKDKDRDYYWSYILAIFDDSIVCYCYESEGYSYYRMGYQMDASGDVEFVGEPVKVDVTMVVKTMGETQDQAAIETDKDESMKEKLNQEGVETKHGSVATDSPSQLSGEVAEVPTPTTEANSAGASVPSPNADATGHTTPELSGEGASAAGTDNSTDGAVKAELDKEAEGLKQDKPVEVNGNPDYLLQGSAKSSHNESLSYIQSFTRDNEGKNLIIQGIATKADIISAAGFVYPLSVWQKNLEPMNELAQAGKFLGKLEHPDKEQGLVDTAIKYNKFWLQGNEVWFEAVVVPTDPYGKNLQALIEHEVQIDISSRGYGSAKKDTWRGQSARIIQDDFVCVGFDAVMHGASTGSRITEAKYQSQNPPTNEEETPMKTQAELDAEARLQSLRDKNEFAQAKKDLLQAAGLNPMGLASYQKALDAVAEGDKVGLVQASDSILPILQATFAQSEEAPVEAATYTPRFYVKQDKSQTAPQNVNELFDRLVEDLPDSNGTVRDANIQGVDQHKFMSPRKQCKQMLINMAQMNVQGFNGADAARGLLMLEQGRVADAENILTQSLPTGATTAASNADNGGAPTSNVMIFPLVRRVFPRYIMNEIASIQPMDRPSGKIFYLDQYRTEDPDGQEKRIDLNTSANPFNTSYADNSTEGAAAEIIRLRLSSVSVDAYTKKLGAAWSIEEMQDLRAYHNLDASQELMDGVAREMALEWNATVLNDMLLQATGAALTFGKTAPASGFSNQVDWDAYIWRYVARLDNLIFSKRNGPMTHLVCGIDAADALIGAARATFDIGGENGGDMREMYPGATYHGVEAPGGQKYKVIKTNFWATGTTNGSKILGLRKGERWSDTPYIWAPYADYVTPLLTDPADFSQKQGIMSRAAKKVVVPDAMGYITVSDSQGVVL
jgi:hypothetical protein